MVVENDVQAAELISKSKSGDLSDIEQHALDLYLEQSGASRDYNAALSAIEAVAAKQSFKEMAETIDSELRLNDVSKERMRRAVSDAALVTDPHHSDVPYPQGKHYLQVAETTDGYSVGLVEEESRHWSSECRFVLLQKIGEGGLGTVWLARDEKLGRNVALKELKPEAAKSPKHWQRFLREAEITGHLEHPNVVPLYMSGINPDTGMPFYVMRFLGKQTLSQAIAEYHAKIASKIAEPVDLHRLLSSFLKVCQAIAYAHARGVIHRDLKPENIVLDNFGQVVVLDWGLAKLESDGELAMKIALSGMQDEAENIFKTFDGSVIGTPLFMSPEQALGKLSEIDFKTDIYGLGAILYAILTGEAPHEHSHKSSDGSLRVDEFLKAIAESNTPIAGDVRSDVPRDLESICARAMAREKFARHSSASELAADVENWIAGRREKRVRFDSMLQQGRDLHSRLCVQMRQHIATAQFMLELPPIQGLLEAVDTDPEQYASWRERLNAILIALVKSRPMATALSYCRVEGDRLHELVRVERSQQDASNIRSMPQSRLRHSHTNTFHRMVMEQFPGEWKIDFDCMVAGTIRIVCGLPVFNEKTEEPFGFVLAEADLRNLINPELSLIRAESQVLVIDHHENILFAAKGNAKANLASEIIPEWREICRALDDESEYLDSKSELYVTKFSASKQSDPLYIAFSNDP